MDILSEVSNGLRKEMEGTMPLLALNFVRWRRAMVRVIERARGVIPGCKPMGSNKGMIGETIKRDDINQWLKQMAIDINKMRIARGVKPLVFEYVRPAHAKSKKQNISA